MKSKSLHKDTEIAATIITNTAEVSARGLAPIKARAAFFIEESSDLMVRQATNKPTVYVCENLIYSIIVTNTGPSNATGVILTDTLPQNSDVISVVLSQGSYFYSNGLLKCQLGNLASGASAVITLIITLKAYGTIHNSVWVTGEQHDPNPENNSSIETTRVNPLNPCCRGFHIKIRIKV